VHIKTFTIKGNQAKQGNRQKMLDRFWQSFVYIWQQA